MKPNRLGIIAVSFLGLIRFSAAQDAPDQKPQRQGQFYFSWGYNRDWYTKSNIHVMYNNPQTKQQCDFMLFSAVAHDKPDMDRYWQPERLTIPQYDLTAGYFFNDKRDFGIEVGWNHLKYVVTDGQLVHIKGEINGNPIDRMWHTNPDTFHLQHTNGNNYLLFNFVKRQRILVREHIQVNAIIKAGVGPMISYTIDKILGDQDPGYFHYHGWVGAVSAGVRVSFLKMFFIQSDAQGAYANYTNTRLGYNHEGRAPQHFYSLQWTWEGGMVFPMGKKIKKQ